MGKNLEVTISVEEAHYNNTTAMRVSWESMHIYLREVMVKKVIHLVAGRLTKRYIDEHGDAIMEAVYEQLNPEDVANAVFATIVDSVKNKLEQE